MSLSVAPVIIADHWKPIEEIDWSFALFVPERKIGYIDQIVRSHSEEWQERGLAARQAYLNVLGQDVIGRTLHRKLSTLLTEVNPVLEILFAAATEIRFRAPGVEGP